LPVFSPNSSFKKPCSVCHGKADKAWGSLLGSCVNRWLWIAWKEQEREPSSTGRFAVYISKHVSWKNQGTTPSLNGLFLNTHFGNSVLTQRQLLFALFQCSSSV
jgi:hypothetical protein